MVGIVRSGIDWVKQNYPTGINRNIAHVWAASLITPGPNRGRHEATFATLGLQGRLTANDRLFQWLNEPESAKKAPVAALVFSQVPDLLYKVLAAATFIATKDISWTDAVSKLLSHSEKVSKIARPYLDQMASLSTDRRLPSARVIALAPVIAKLMHMALIYADPKGENSVLELLKTGTNRTSQGLEFLWNLRFFLVCMAIPKTFYATATSVAFKPAYQWVVRRFVPGKQIQGILSTLPFLFNPFPDSQTYWNHFLRLIKGDAYWPAMGCEVGLQGMWNSFQASSAPYDTTTLERLFNEADALDGTLNNLGAFRGQIDTVLSDIALAQEEGQISEELAANLTPWVDGKTLKKLAVFLQDPAFVTELDKADVSLAFKGIYCYKVSEIQAEALLNFLKKLHQTTLSTDDLSQPVQELHDLFAQINQLMESQSMTHAQALVCQQLLFEKVKQSFVNTIIPNLFPREPGDVPAWLAAALNYLQACKNCFPGNDSEINAWSSAILNKIFENFPRHILLDALVEGEQEQHYIAIFGKNGIVHKFATTREESCAAYLLSSEFQLRRFNLNLDWYMYHQPEDAQAREKCELLLLQQALEAQFDYEVIADSPEFEMWAKMNPRAAHISPKERVKIYMMNYIKFDFARGVPPIPERFVFSTYALPYILDLERRQVNAPMNTFVYARNLDPRFGNRWTDTAQPPELKSEMERELSEMESLLGTAAFVSSRSIQEAAKG